MDYLLIAIMVAVFGVNTLFWAVVGAGRLGIERVRLIRFGQRHQRAPKGGGHRFEPRDVAILIPAHNERAVLGETLARRRAAGTARQHLRGLRRLHR